MAKKTKIPKKVAGIRIPKAIRRSTLLRSLLNSPMGRNIVADALVAGAAAAAAALVRDRDDVARQGRRTVTVVGEAIQDAADAVMDVVSNAAASLAPDAPKKRKGRRAPDTVRH